MTKRTHGNMLNEKGVMDMPFKSKAQQKFMFAKKPEIASRWAKDYGVKDLSKKKKSPWEAMAKKKEY